MFDFITKPILPDELRRILTKVGNSEYVKCVFNNKIYTIYLIKINNVKLIVIVIHISLLNLFL